MSWRPLTKLCSSTIIQNIISHCQADPGLAIGFYYFDFNDIEKQKAENLIRSLVTQISSQCRNTSVHLNILYSKCPDGKQSPSVDSLISTLQQMRRYVDERNLSMGQDISRPKFKVTLYIDREYRWNSYRIQRTPSARQLLSRRRTPRFLKCVLNVCARMRRTASRSVNKDS